MDEALSNLLERLGPDPGPEYEALRRKLETVFRCRGLPDAEGLVDQTIDRLTSVISREQVEHPVRFALGVARNIAREAARRPRTTSLDALPELPSREEIESGGVHHQRMDCLDQCLTHLPEPDRSLVLRYYQGQGLEKVHNHRKLAQELGISDGTLRVRALRMRKKLQQCVLGCLRGKRGL